ncbi:MAG: hypothetical protein U0270_16580 [Labilithrix sp.]
MAAKRKLSTDAKKVTSKERAATSVDPIVAPVWKSPDDDDLKAVVGDALLEAGSPWGELIGLQLKVAAKKATPADRKLALTLAKRGGCEVALLGDGEARHLDRADAKSPWRVAKATSTSKFYGKYLAAFAKGLSPAEQKALEIAPTVQAPKREMLEAALAAAGIKRPSTLG